MGKVCCRMFENVTLEYTKVVQMLPPRSILQRNIRTFDAMKMETFIRLVHFGPGKILLFWASYFCLHSYLGVIQLSFLFHRASHWNSFYLELRLSQLAHNWAKTISSCLSLFQPSALVKSFWRSLI